MMPRHIPNMFGILGLVTFLVSADAVQGEEPLTFVHSGFQVTSRTDVPTTSTAVSQQDVPQKTPPNPDSLRQKPAQPNDPVNSDAPKRVSSRPAKPAYQNPDRLTQREQVLSYDRLASLAHDHGWSDLHDQSNKDAPVRADNSTVPTPARREISTQTRTIASKDASNAIKRDRTGRWTEEDRLAWRDHRGEGTLINTELQPATLNTTPLTEDQIKSKVSENNAREQARVDEEKRQRDHKYKTWTAEERREWIKTHPVKNDGGWDDHVWPENPPWPDNQKFITAQPGKIQKLKPVPGKSWREERDYRRDHQREYSRYDRQQRRYYYPADLGRTVVVLPSEFDPLSVHGQTYYYSGGIFYARQADNFANVPAPMGALVTTLPSEYVEITLKGVKYATAGGVYYTKVLGGYEVVEPPDGLEDVIIAKAPKTVNGDEAIIVSIRDDAGDYIEIPLTRFGKGFHGPQGEYYPAFPPIEQLREMYFII